MILTLPSAARRTGLAALLLAATIVSAAAQTQDSTPVVIGGFVDSYFNYNFGRPVSHANQLRAFDVTENGFTMANAELSVSKTASPLGFRLDLDFGPTNDIVQSGAGGSIAMVGQAYATYVAPVGKGLTIDAGKFATHMGYEVLKAKDNYNYSRSNLFWLSIPIYHLGARASYPIGETTTIMACIHNSYNGLTVNPGKTFGLQVITSPAAGLTVVGNYIGGPALPDTVSKKWRNVANLIVTYQATDKLTFVVDGVYGQENLPGGIALWKGAAAYIHYQICDPSALTLRGELYADPMAFNTGGAATDIKGVTLTYEYKPLANLILRAEYRYDTADAGVYDGNSGPAARKNQATLGAGAIVVF